MTEEIVWTFVAPFLGGVLTCFLGGRLRDAGGVLAAGATALSVGWLVIRQVGKPPIVYELADTPAPLGIVLYMDGLALLLLAMTALIGVGVSLYSLGYFRQLRPEHTGSNLFWPLWLLLWGGLNLLFLSGDVFNLYLLLEFTLLAAVALAALGGSHASHVSALRYLLAASAAALFYLVGVAVLYSEAGTLDLLGLARAEIRPTIAALSLALMTLGLALKCALFPLHFWLPAAHSSAPAPVSAVLSAVVVKAAFYVILRLWLEVLPEARPPWSAEILAVLGAMAILWGSWQALWQRRLKMLVAYSTVAQVGYLFLLLPMSTGRSTEVFGATCYHMLSHGLAKAGMFLGAGALLKSAPSDLLEHTRGAARHSPLAVLAVLISGGALAGIVPGGGAKGTYLGLIVEAGQWWWAPVVVAGMALALAYTVLAVWRCFAWGPVSKVRHTWLGLTALLVAFCAVALSFFSRRVLRVLEGSSPW